jgi:CheY-like chemotaxis protein
MILYYFRDLFRQPTILEFFMLVPRILVVEDESATAIDLREQLMKLGYEVSYLVATDDHALHTIEQSRPDLILMDIRTHGDLGDIALATGIPPSHRTPVVWLTARRDETTGDPPKPPSKSDSHKVIQVTFARRQAAPGKAETPRPPVSGTNGSHSAIAEPEHGQEEASPVEWRKSQDSMFASIPSDSVPYHLVVERLPSRKAWDWAVWQPGDRADVVLHGRASSSASAMAAAEAAAAEKRDIEAARNRSKRQAQG